MEWERLGAMAAVHHFAADLPCLQEIFVAFLRGALDTWIRFSAEFEEEGDIARLTGSERQLYRMLTTNDANKGALGEFRSFARQYPTGGLELFNALKKYKHNNMQDFMDNVLATDADGAFLRKEARARIDAKLDKKKRLEIAEINLQEVKEKREIRNKKQTKHTKRLE